MATPIETRTATNRWFRPKLIFVNRYFHPDHSATSQMLSDLAFALAEAGHDVHVITSRQRYDSPRKQLAAQERVAGVDVRRVWTSRFGRGGLVGRAVDYLSFYVTAAIALWRLARTGDVIVAKTDPPMLSVMAAPIARQRRAHLINWLQDIFPEVAKAVGMGRGRLGSIAFGVLRWLRDRSLKRAVVNVAIGERMAERMVALGVERSRITVIPNWADGALVTPRAHACNAVRADVAGPSDFVVAYSGNLGRAHEIDAMLGAIAATQANASSPVAAGRVEVVRGPRIVWLFVGGGSLMQSLQRSVAKRGLRSVVFRPYQPRGLLADSLSAADVHLVSLRPELEGLIVPSKIYGIMAAGRATIFIGDADGEVARALARADCGVTVTSGDGAALAAAIAKLARDRARTRVLGDNARRAFERECDKPLAIARWVRLVGDVGGGTGGSQT